MHMQVSKYYLRERDSFIIIAQVLTAWSRSCSRRSRTSYDHKLYLIASEMLNLLRHRENEELRSTFIQSVPGTLHSIMTSSSICCSEVVNSSDKACYQKSKVAGPFRYEMIL
ncbi:unnamed protein product [Amoebophrya sp. A120]|nr:unnamed protein product [Amoebophrya sp. A120]|eukprot:GSA120T00010003001.1